MRHLRCPFFIYAREVRHLHVVRKDLNRVRSELISLRKARGWRAEAGSKNFSTEKYFWPRNYFEQSEEFCDQTLSRIFSKKKTTPQESRFGFLARRRFGFLARRCRHHFFAGTCTAPRLHGMGFPSCPSRSIPTLMKSVFETSRQIILFWSKGFYWLHDERASVTQIIKSQNDCILSS